MRLGHAREAREIGGIATMCHDQRAVDDRAGINGTPESQPAAAEIAHDRRRTLNLAFGRNHRAGPAARGIGEWDSALFDETDAMPGPRKRERLPETDDAGARYDD